MRSEPIRRGVQSGSTPNVEFLLLDPDVFNLAWDEFLAEDYEASLDRVRRCLEEGQAGRLTSLSIVPQEGVPTLRDGVVLCARNLYQLDRFAEFEVLQASAGRWGLVSDGFVELEVIELAFACKRGEYRQVVQHCTAMIDAQRSKLPPVLADFLYLRGLAFSHLGKPEEAREDTEAAYALFRILKKDYESGRSANLMGMIEFRGSDYEAAEKWFQRALELHTLLNMRKNMGGNRLNLGIAAYKRGSFAAAHSHFRAAERLCREVDAQVSLCRASLARGNTFRLQREPESARRHLMRAYEDANRLMLPREEALALEFLGDVARDDGQIETARRYYSRSLAIGRSIAPDGDVVMEVMRRQGQCLQLLGRNSEALSVLGTARTMARRQGDRFEEGVALRTIAEALLGMGDLDSASRHAIAAVNQLTEVDARFEAAQARIVSARIGLAQAGSGLLRDATAVLETGWQEAMSALHAFLDSDVEHWILTARRVVSELSALRAEQGRLSVPVSASADRVGRPTGPQPIIHVSTRMRDLLQLCDAFADSAEPVLVTGDTGTGKELFARRLHDKSTRQSGELVCVNVTAIPREIFAREFFGHVRGSFTGADAGSIGLAARADGGTLFLDEIGDLPLELQPQLLRLLQDGTYHAIGDPAERTADIRLIAATNADLQQRVAEGRFRADLYYRLKILELRLPPMQERREDVMPLLRHFLSQSAGREVDPTEYFHRDSLEAMRGYAWPGNVREIAMFARQAVVQLESRGQVEIEIDSGPGGLLHFTGPESPPRAINPQSVSPSRGTAEDLRQHLLLALAETDGNRAEAARRLGVSRSTLYRRMEKLGILGKVAQA